MRGGDCSYDGSRSSCTDFDGRRLINVVESPLNSYIGYGCIFKNYFYSGISLNIQSIQRQSETSQSSRRGSVLGSPSIIKCERSRCRRYFLISDSDQCQYFVQKMSPKLNESTIKKSNNLNAIELCRGKLHIS